MKIKYTKEQLEAVMDEVGRRINSLISEGEFKTAGEIHDTRADMMQGVFSMICATADKDDLAGYWDTIDEIWTGKADNGDEAWMYGRW